MKIIKYYIILFLYGIVAFLSTSNGAYDNDIPPYEESIDELINKDKELLRFWNSNFNEADLNKRYKQLKSDLSEWRESAHFYMKKFQKQYSSNLNDCLSIKENDLFNNDKFDAITLYKKFWLISNAEILCDIYNYLKIKHNFSNPNAEKLVKNLKANIEINILKENELQLLARLIGDYLINCDNKNKIIDDWQKQFCKNETTNNNFLPIPIFNPDFDITSKINRKLFGIKAHGGGALLTGWDNISGMPSATFALSRIILPDRNKLKNICVGNNKGGVLITIENIDKKEYIAYKKTETGTLVWDCLSADNIFARISTSDCGEFLTSLNSEWAVFKIINKTQACSEPYAFVLCDQIIIRQIYRKTLEKMEPDQKLKIKKFSELFSPVAGKLILPFTGIEWSGSDFLFSMASVDSMPILKTEQEFSTSTNLPVEIFSNWPFLKCVFYDGSTISYREIDIFSLKSKSINNKNNTSNFFIGSNPDGFTSIIKADKNKTIQILEQQKSDKRADNNRPFAICLTSNDKLLQSIPSLDFSTTWSLYNSYSPSTFSLQSCKQDQLCIGSVWKFVDGQYRNLMVGQITPLVCPWFHNFASPYYQCKKSGNIYAIAENLPEIENDPTKPPVVLLRCQKNESKFNQLIKLDALSVCPIAVDEESGVVVVSKKGFSQSNQFDIVSLKSGQIIGTIVNSNDSCLIYLPSGFYASSKSLVSNISMNIGYRAYPFEQFDLRLNRPDIVLERLGAPDEAITIAKQLREKRLKRMGVTEEMLQPDFHLPEIEILGDLPSTTAENELALNIKASDSKYPLDRLRVYVNNVPVNGKEGELLRDAKSQTLERNIPIKLAAGRNKIQVSVLNSAGAESLYANAEVTCTAQRPKPTLYAVAMGVSEYANPEWNLKYAAKDATDILARIHSQSGSSYGEVKELLLTDREVTKENLAKIREFLSKATVGDTVLMFVAGHGLLDSKYDYYFGTSDIDFENPSGKGIAFEEFDDLLAELPCLKKSLLIDTCHAGELDEDEKKALAAAQSAPTGQQVAMHPVGARGMSVKPVEGARGKSEWYDRLQGLFVDLRRGSGSTILSSSAGAEYALESSEQKNGLFTYAVLEALDGKEGSDANKDGSVTMSELAEHVKSRVATLTNNKQSPNVRRVNLEADFALTKQ